MVSGIKIPFKTTLLPLKLAVAVFLVRRIFPCPLGVSLHYTFKGIHTHTQTRANDNVIKLKTQ